MKKVFLIIVGIVFMFLGIYYFINKTKKVCKYLFDECDNEPIGI